MPPDREVGSLTFFLLKGIQGGKRGTPRPARWVPWFVAVALGGAGLLAVAAWGIFRSPLALVESLRQGGSAGPAVPSTSQLPRFSLPMVDGSHFSSDRLRGKPAVINFFATWCPSCWAEVPMLEVVYRQHRANGLMVVGIGVLEDARSTSWMARRLGISFPVTYDATGEVVTKVLKLRTMPTTLFVDRNGNILVRWEGVLDKARFQRYLSLILRS